MKGQLGGFPLAWLGIRQAHREWLNLLLDKCVTEHFAKFSDCISGHELKSQITL